MKPIYNILPAILCAGLLYGCLDNPGLPEGIVNGGAPEIVADSIVATKANAIEAHATIARHKGSAATEYGFYVRKENDSENRAVNAEAVPLANGTISYNVLIDDLEPYTTYILRAFARNDLGEGLGIELKRTTTTGLGQVETLPPDSIHGTYALAGGQILEPGEGNLLQRGIYRSLQADMADKDTLFAPLAVDSFVFRIANLDTMTTYYVQAFVHNDYGIFTGNIEAFTTKNGRPEFESFTLVDWQFNDASYAADLASEGDAPLTVKGICLSENPDPDTNDTVNLSNAAGLHFTGHITGLKPFTKYYIRAFARNEPFGTTYSNTLEFTTHNNQPTVESIGIFSIYDGAAGVEGEVTSSGMGTITNAGYCWSTSTNPTVLNSYTILTNSQSYFRGYITGLRGGLTYYIRAFAQNSSGQTAYGAELTINTPPIFTQMATFTGDARIPNSPTSFVIGNTAYLTGGDKGLAFTNELMAYHSSNQWSPVAPFPSTARKWQTAVALSDVAYLFGGIDALSVRSNETHRYLPSQNQWEAVATTNTPDPIHSQAAVAFGTNAYFIGGCRDTVTTEVWSFNPFSRYWDAKRPLPEPQYAGIAININGIVYVGLGLNNTSGTTSHKRLWSTSSFDTWTEETSLPASAGHVRGGVAYKGAIYIVDSAGAIWKYNLTEKTWTKKSTLPAGNAGDSQHCIFVLDNMIYTGLGVSQKSLLKYDPVWDN
ncbi:MAG: hypothetical protein LBS05_11245 [Tannerellaceae bacterium]|jgi:N-acetylneuraminic acid mutarotase|nr:hypothetical protein [Tannerellaceae bacterium]